MLNQDDNSDTLRKLAPMLVDEPQKNTKRLLKQAYIKIRNPVAHGRTPEMEIDMNFVKGLEDCVRQVIRRTIGLTSNGVRGKEALQNRIEEAEILNKATKSDRGTRKLFKDADDGLFLTTKGCRGTFSLKSWS